MGIIQQLKTAGTLTFYHDYRARHSDDLSGNDVAFTVNGTHSYGRDGRDPLTTTSYLTTTDNSLDFDASGEMTIAVLFEYNTKGGNKLIKNALFDNTGYYLQTTTNRIYFLEDDASSSKYTPAILVEGNIHSAIITYNNQTVNIYIDGVNQSLSTAGTPVWVSDTTSTFNIGDSYAPDNYLGEYGSALHISRAITATEAAELHSELINAKWPSKTQGRSINNQQAIVGETGLVGAWDMKPVGGVVQDLSNNGNDGTIFGGPTYEKTILGNSMRFDGTDDYIVLSDIDLTNTTVSVWVKTTRSQNECVIANDVVNAGTGSWGIMLRTDGIVRWYYGENNRVETATGLITNTDIWQHVAVTQNSNDVVIYIDGVNVKSQTVTGIVNSNVNTYIGSNKALDYFFIGSIANPTIYNAAKDQAWVTKEYLKGANAVPYKTDFAANVSTANITAGELENTGWTVGSGSFQVQMEDGVKIIKCISAGDISKPTSQDATGASFGTWEMDIWKDLNAGIFNVGFAIDQWSPQNGYIMQYFSDEKIYITEYTGGGSASHKMSDTTFAIATWHNVKIRRTSASVFSVEMNGTVLDTPWTDASGIKTSGNVLALDMDTGDKIKLSNVSGDNAFIKRLGVV